MLRSALPRTVPETRFGGRRDLQRAIGIHEPDRPRALGNAAARARDRGPLLRGRGRAERGPRQQPRDLRRLPDRGLLGPRARARAARVPRGPSRARQGRPEGDARELSRAEAPGARLTTNALQTARDRILTPSGLDDGRLEQALGSLLGASVDAGDLYFQL